MELSARTQPPGTVAALTLGTVMAEVTIDSGDGKTIVAAVTRGSVEQLGLREGSSVVAPIKATEVMVGTRRRARAGEARTGRSAWTSDGGIERAPTGTGRLGTRPSRKPPASDRPTATDRVRFPVLRGRPNYSAARHALRPTGSGVSMPRRRRTPRPSRSSSGRPQTV